MNPVPIGYVLMTRCLVKHKEILLLASQLSEETEFYVR